MPDKLFALPIIRKAEYEAFRRAVGPNLADTYDEWASLFADEIEEARREGLEIIDVEVQYDEFIAFCRANGHQPNAQTLLDFALTKKRARRD